MKIPDYLKPAYKLANKKGWEIRLTRSSHLRWKSPEGRIVITSGNSKVVQGRTMKNELSHLAKAGLFAK